MALYTLYIVNKAGGLVFNKVFVFPLPAFCVVPWPALGLVVGECVNAVDRCGAGLQDLSPGLPRLSSNDYLRSASTFHSLYAIASQV
jgi:hypothetical protein